MSHPHQKVYNAVARAIRAGVLVRPKTCSQCGGGGRIHGHHDDYSKPLVVRWLCPGCHHKRHPQDPIPRMVAIPSGGPSPYRLVPGFVHGRECLAGGHLAVYDRLRGFAFDSPYRYIVMHHPSGVWAPATSMRRATSGVLHALFDPSRLTALKWMVGHNHRDENGQHRIYGTVPVRAASESEAA